MTAISIGTVFNNVWPILAAIGVFLVLIMIHEFGHFIFAKMLGVKVNEYSIGFGPAIFKKQGKETLYSLRIIPFGGYCAMEGEETESDNPNGFCNKKPWRRLLIIIAGAAFNLILGFILIFCTLIPEKSFTSTKVAGFYTEENGIEAISPDYGLMVDDEIIEVDGRRIFSVVDLSYSFAGVEDGKIDMVVLRNGSKVALDGVQFKHVEEDGISFITPDFYVYGIKKTFISTIEETAKQSLSYSRTVIFSLVDLIRGKYGISQVSGPVGVTAAISDAAKISFVALLKVMALVTINLGIFNLLPIPALDGSRALFILAEMIFRKLVPKKFEAVVHAVGFAILILFILAVTVKDILGFIL